MEDLATRRTLFRREMRDLRFVPRWAILRRGREQNVAEHSYYVALYAMEIAMFIGWPGDRLALMHSALVHDLPEVWTGDMPRPAKRVMVQRQALQSLEQRRMADIFPFHASAYKSSAEDSQQNGLREILACADSVEAVMFLADELNMGNRSVGVPTVTNTPFGDNYLAMLNRVGKLPCDLATRQALAGRLVRAVEEAISHTSDILVG